jgi:hypothetical protein
MDYLIQLLIERLVAEGIELTFIPAFVRDVSRIVATNPPQNLEAVNDQLHLLGWDGIDLDGFSLQLIIANLVPDLIYERAYSQEKKTGLGNPQNTLIWKRRRLHS